MKTPRLAFLLPMLGLFVIGFPTDIGAADKSSPEAVKELKVAAKLLSTRGGREKGIAKLREIIQKYPKDPAAKKAKEFLLANGIGEHVRVQLIDSKVFNKRFKYSEKFIVELSEIVLRELGVYFKGLKPYYPEHLLHLVFYDSQARYRKASGSIYSGGHFTERRSSQDPRELEGEIVWYFPQRSGTATDRLTRVKTVLYHETMHFLNATYFGGLVPSIFNEGLAEFVQTRLNTTYYQTNRRTEREIVESYARNGLNAIVKYPDFLKYLGSSVGYGRGDRMRQRWYGFCYSVVDFIERGKIGDKKASIKMLFGKLTKKLEPLLEEEEAPRPLTNKLFLAEVARDFYSVDLKTFHAALVKHILANYRQR